MIYIYIGGPVPGPPALERRPDMRPARPASGFALRRSRLGAKRSRSVSVRRWRVRRAQCAGDSARAAGIAARVCWLP